MGTCRSLGYPFLYAQNHGKAQIRPVHVSRSYGTPTNVSQADSFLVLVSMSIQMENVSQALKNLMDMDKTSIGQTYNLPGPKTYTNREFLALLAETLADPKHSSRSFHLPKPIMQLIASLSNRFIWWPTMDSDQIERKYIDELSDRQIRMAGKGLSAEASWRALDIIPDALEDEIARYVKWMRKPENFMKPSTSGTVYGK